MKDFPICHQELHFFVIVNAERVWRSSKEYRDRMAMGHALDMAENGLPRLRLAVTETGFSIPLSSHLHVRFSKCVPPLGQGPNWISIKPLRTALILVTLCNTRLFNKK
jgi:hypothetical protein